MPSWWIVGIAALLLLSSAPALTARLLELPGNPVRFAMLEGREVSKEDLARLESSRKRVVDWFPRNENINDLALIAFTRGGQTKGEEARMYFAESESWQRKALEESPADPYGWFRLAFLLFAEDGPLSSRSAAAWTQSMAVAPYEPTLMIPRLQMGMNHYNLLTPEAKSYIPLLIRGSSVFDADELARMAKAGKFTGLVEEALANDEEALKGFRQRLRR